MIKLELDQNEVQFLISVLGDLQIKTGAAILVSKIQTQAQPQMEPPKVEANEVQ